MKNNKNIHLNTSSKYKHNKFQIKYLKAKKNNIVLFAEYDTYYTISDILCREYYFFIYFNRNKRSVHYINDCDIIKKGNGYAYNINALMKHFNMMAYKFIQKTAN